MYQTKCWAYLLSAFGLASAISDHHFWNRKRIRWCSQIDNNQTIMELTWIWNKDRLGSSGHQNSASNNHQIGQFRKSHWPERIDTIQNLELRAEGRVLSVDASKTEGIRQKGSASKSWRPQILTNPNWRTDAKIQGRWEKSILAGSPFVTNGRAWFDFENPTNQSWETTTSLPSIATTSWFIVLILVLIVRVYFSSTFSVDQKIRMTDGLICSFKRAVNRPIV